MLKQALIGLLIILLTGAILAFDAALKLFGWPTISQSIIFWTNQTPLVPWLIGMFMGGLGVHWFESYFLRGEDEA